MYSIKNKLKIGLLSLFVLPFLVGGVSYGASDLLRHVMEPSIKQELTIHMGENVKTVGEKFWEGGTTDGKKSAPSTIVKFTRLLLIIVIALSVTMILYNGMKYIIDTGNGKEGKSLVKNVVYIVIGILISLFSVVIITLIQSIPSSIDTELKFEANNRTDNQYVEDKKGVSWIEMLRGLSKK